MSSMLASSYVALAADTATRIFPWYVTLRQSELEPCCWLHDWPPELERQSALELEPCQGLQELEPCQGLHEPLPWLIVLVWGGELKPKLQLANLRRHTYAHKTQHTTHIHVYPSYMFIHHHHHYVFEMAVRHGCDTSIVEDDKWWRLRLRWHDDASCKKPPPPQPPMTTTTTHQHHHPPPPTTATNHHPHWGW